MRLLLGILIWIFHWILVISVSLVCVLAFCYRLSGPPDPTGAWLNEVALLSLGVAAIWALVPKPHFEEISDFVEMFEFL